MQNTALIIAAAGKGSRMGAGINKQFIELEGKAILVHTLQKFALLKNIGQVIILHHKDEKEAMEKLLSSIHLPFDLTYVVGGNTRQASVYKGLKSLRASIRKVIIHDGARPFVTTTMFHEMEGFIACLEDEPKVAGAFFGVPLKDTVKQETDSGFITLDRSALYAVQTPQIFEKKRLLEAHEKSLEKGFEGTDDCSLIEREGGRIIVLAGDYRNIKVTTQEDLVVAAAFMKAY